MDPRLMVGIILLVVALSVTIGLLLVPAAPPSELP
jgi:hypothetical protein